MKSRFTGILTLFLAFMIQFSFAQEKTITGTVTSAEYGALIGAAVTVDGTTRGTQTDENGIFSISAQQGDVLTISYVGMKDSKINVGASNVYNVNMETQERTIDEILVVGYGTSTKEQFTGTATKINKENIEAKTVSNISQALRGEVAGVSVFTGSGAPGADATIRIRGFGSINGNQAPLYVVDGAPYSSDISSINPADIEDMVVLKDAAATSIYGSRGANGVILITTKKGKAGTSVISVDLRTSINTLMLPNYDIVTSPEEYIEMSWLSLRNKGALLGETNPNAWASNNLYGTAEGIDPAYNIWNAPGNALINPATGKFNEGIDRKFTPTKWSDAAFGTGYRSEANIQFSGGNDKTRYATSFGYLNDEGYTVKSNYTRFTSRLSVEHKPKDWLKIGGNMAYTGARYTNSSSDEGSAGSSGNIFALTNTTPAIYDVYLRDTNGELIADPIFGGWQYDYGAMPYNRRAWNSTNGIADAHYDLSRDDSSTLLGNFNIGIDFTDWLTFETRYSGQHQSYDSTSRNNPFYGGWSGDAYGYLFRGMDTRTNQNFLQLLRFNESFGDHSVEAFVAHETTEWRRKSMSAAATGAILPFSLDLAQYTSAYGRASSFSQGWTLESYFSQLNYNYAGKYFLTASARRDGSSRFIQDKWGTFWSVGAGWVMSKESFMDNASFVDYLKLKASYGWIGDVGNDLMYGFQIYNIEQTTDGSISYFWNDEQANPELTWETSKITQVGIESSWFNNTLDVDVDYYIKDTENLFFVQQLSPSVGGGQTFRRYNDGKLRNSGLEFDVAVHLFKAKTAEDFRLSVGFNGEILNNEIRQMPVDLATGERKVIDGNLSVGHSMYDWRMREWAGVDPATGSAMWTMHYFDNNDNGIFDAGDEFINSLEQRIHDNPDGNVQTTTTTNYAQATTKYIGKSAIPKVRGAFRLNAAYKNFDLTAQFSYNIGGYVYDNGYATLMSNSGLIGANNWHTDMRESWQQPGDVTNVPRMSAFYNTDSQFNAQSSRFLTKADFLSLNNLRLGYTIPKEFTNRMHLSNLNLYVSGDNLMMLSARKGLNPTTLISSSNSGIYMPMTTFSFGAKIDF